MIRRAEVSQRRVPRLHGRAALRWRRGRRRARPYPARSPKAEAFQRAIDVIGDRWPRRSEQREFRDRRFSFTCESRNGLTKQLRLAAPALPGESRQRPLKLRWKIHRRLRHTLCIPYVMTPWGGTKGTRANGGLLAPSCLPVASDAGMTRQLGGPPAAAASRSLGSNWRRLGSPAFRPGKPNESVSCEGCHGEAWCGLQRRHAKAGSLLLIPHWTRAFDF